MKRKNDDPRNLDRLDTLLREANAAIGASASSLNGLYVELQRIRLKVQDYAIRRAPAVSPARPRRRRRRVVR